MGTACQACLFHLLIGKFLKHIANRREYVQAYQRTFSQCSVKWQHTHNTITCSNVFNRAELDSILV